MKTEKHFQHKPLPASKCAEIPKDMMQKHGPNYMLDNWDIETNKEHGMLAEETWIPKITHPSGRLCSKSSSLQVTMQPQTALDKDPPISSKPSHTSPKTKTGGNVVHASGRICSKMNTHLNPDKKGSNITTTSGRKKELKVTTTRIDNLVYSSKLYSPSAPIVWHRSRCICSKQTELKVSMTTIKQVPEKQVGNLSAPIIRHHRGCICSKQNGLKVATTTATNVAPNQ